MYCAMYGMSQQHQAVQPVEPVVLDIMACILDIVSRGPETAEAAHVARMETARKVAPKKARVVPRGPSPLTVENMSMRCRSLCAEVNHPKRIRRAATVARNVIPSVQKFAGPMTKRVACSHQKNGLLFLI